MEGGAKGVANLVVGRGAFLVCVYIFGKVPIDLPAAMPCGVLYCEWYFIIEVVKMIGKM